MRMNPKDRDFERIARYFMEIRGFRGQFTLEKVPGGKATTRILRMGRENTFMVKVFMESFPSDKNVFHAQNEVAIGETLKDLSLSTKKYLFVKTDSDNPVGVPFAVSTYIVGENLKKVNKRKIVLIVPKVLDYLFFLHSITPSKLFGYIGFLKERKPMESTFSFGQFESAYLRADIQREGIIFSPQEKKNLNQAVEILNQEKLFCLCHWDITRENTLWDGCKVHLIDWSYAHYADPASDIAGVTFWLMESGSKSQIRQELSYIYKRYLGLGFDIVPTLLFYLIQRHIELGRIKGKIYLEKGKKLLRCLPVNSLEKLIDAIFTAMI